MPIVAGWLSVSLNCTRYSRISEVVVRAERRFLGHVRRALAAHALLGAVAGRRRHHRALRGPTAPSLKQRSPGFMPVVPAPPMVISGSTRGPAAAAVAPAAVVPATGTVVPAIGAGLPSSVAAGPPTHAKSTQQRCQAQPSPLTNHHRISLSMLAPAPRIPHRGNRYFRHFEWGMLYQNRAALPRPGPGRTAQPSAHSWTRLSSSRPLPRFTA